jgi:hypothetical protein
MLPDDPITGVDWTGATVTLPPSDYCPTGTVTFAEVDSESGGTTNPRVFRDGRVIELYPDHSFPSWAYGDVTGDGRLDVVLEVQCFLSDHPGGHGSGHGGHLLAVARADDGGLAGLGFLGPRGAAITEVWVADGRVLMVGDPWTANPEDHFPGLPGLVLSYRWDGSRFVGWEPAADYPPIVPLDPGGPGAPVRPRAVAEGLGCPDLELRFTRPEADWSGTATAGGATFTILPRYQQQHLLDLDNTGDRLLVTAISCTAPEGWTRAGLAVFERAAEGWQGISVLIPPAGHEPLGWDLDAGGRLRVEWHRQLSDGENSSVITGHYRWTGTELVPDP